HPGEKPYKYLECGKSFVQSSDLLIHNLIRHLGLQPYKCRDRRKSFGIRSVLVIHQQLHRGTHPSEHPVCGKSF
ncbi:ZN572 protein, partial [Dromas ardeola]|nr:ZN572 protein [Dromas ardeola]